LGIKTNFFGYFNALICVYMAFAAVAALPAAALMVGAVGLATSPTAKMPGTLV
jgi:hypothetical protein